MTTILEKGDYKITFNGSKTYFVIDSADQCLLATDTLRKATNKFNRILKMTNNA